MNFMTTLSRQQKFSIFSAKSIGNFSAKFIGVAVTSLTAAVMTLGSDPAHAANFSYTGTLNNPNDFQSFFFTANGTSNVNLRSYSYAGGTNAAGTVITAGGFDPILSLFDSSDALIQTVDDGPLTVPADPFTGARYDTNFSQALTAGNYRVAVSQFSNFAIGPNFSNGFPRNQSSFQDVTGAVRTANWAFDITGVDTATGPSTNVPEPFTIVGTLIGSVAAFRMRKRLKVTNKL
jgi:hypothetical protein